MHEEMARDSPISLAQARYIETVYVYLLNFKVAAPRRQ